MVMPENPAYPPINGTGCQILGVVQGRFTVGIRVKQTFSGTG